MTIRLRCSIILNKVSDYTVNPPFKQPENTKSSLKTHFQAAFS